MTSAVTIEACPGCGLAAKKTDGPVHRYLGSTAYCWAKYGELLAREYQDFEYMKVHDLTVDTYALQHPGGESPQTISSSNVHLASLYAYFERGVPVSELSKIKQNVVRLKDQFVWLPPPEEPAGVTVADILQARSAGEHSESITHWARAVFDTWRDNHGTASDLLDKM